MYLNLGETHLSHRPKKEGELPFLIVKTGNITGVSEHRHDFFEFTFIIHGSGIHHVNGKAYPFDSHQICFVPPGTSHSFSSASSETHSQFSFCIYPELYRLQGNAGMLQTLIGDTLTRLSEEKRYVIRVPDEKVGEITRLIEGIFFEHTFSPRAHSAMILLELNHFFIQLDRILNEDDTIFNRFRSANPLVVLILKKMESEYYEPLHIPELARAMDLNEKYLIRLFKKEIGIPPHQYLNRLRLEMFCKKISYFQGPISDLAFQCGFIDVRHFNRQFKKWTGIRPTDLLFLYQTEKTLLGKLSRFESHLHLDRILPSSKKAKTWILSKENLAPNK